jgi:hypothetical protein
MLIGKVGCLAAAVVITAASTAQAQPQWSAVDQEFGRQGTTQPDGVRRYSFPRSDLHVTLDGVAIRPALALGSWLAFEPMQKSAMVMGDLVLTQDEVNPVMTELLNDGIEVTAVHNHLLRSSPAIMYMHVEARGDPVRLAHVLHAALARSRTPLQLASASPSAPIALDTAAIDAIIGSKGKVTGGVYQFSIARREKISESGMPAPATMGTATGINFQPLGGGRAAATGDFVLIASEVEPVMRALTSSSIEVTALHSHMIHEQPRLFFMHFWAQGDAGAIAGGLRRAIDQTRR